MEGDSEQIDDQTDQRSAQSPNLQQPALAAPPASYPQPAQFPDQLPPGSFPSQPPFPFPPANFNPAALPPLGTNPPFAQPPVSGPPPSFQVPPTSSMAMQMDQVPSESVAHPLTRPPFFMPPGPAPFGVRPPMGLPQHFAHPPPHMLPRPRSALPPPSAFYQDTSMMNPQFGFYPLNVPPPSEQNNGADLWVETSTPEGKVYYYHSKTRESSWTKPSGSSSKVVTQAEFEVMSHRPAVNQTDMANNAANSIQQQQQQQHDVDSNKEAESEYLTGSPPQWTLTHEQSISTPAGPEGVATSEASTEETPASATNPANPASQSQVLMPSPCRLLMDENLERMAREWSEHRNEYGRIYYYNSRSMESTWEVPPVLMEFREKQRMLLMNGMSMVPQVATTSANQTPQMSAEEEEKLKMDAKAAEEERKKKKQQEASKPIFTRPIPATPWCMVWTKDNRIFFHNPSTGASLWDCPVDMLGRPDVQKWMSEEPPSSDPGKNDPKKLDEPAAKRQKLDVETTTQTQPLNTSSSYFPSLQNAFQSGYPPGFSFGQQQQQQQFDQQQQQQHHQQQQQQHQQQQNLTDGTKAKQNIGEQNMAAGDKSSAEERLQKFMELLAEKEVSAFSTWEKELPKLVFDPRYLMLPAKERKPAFEQYLRTRCDEERKEKLQKMKMKKDEFKKLLHEANMTVKWTFLDFCSKFSRDEKFKAVEKMKERESLFNEFITDLRKRAKMDTKTAHEQAKKDFIQLLKEKVPHSLLVAGSYWQDARVYIQSDPRYRAVLDYPHESEDWYKEYCKLPSNGEGSDEGELLDEIDEQTRKARERQERVEASLRQREKVVQESLYASLMERDKERKSHMREESIQHFKALMADMVKSADVSWRDTRHNLRKDARWSLAKHIEKEEKEQLFEEHVSNLSKKNKLAFHRLLDETLAGSLTTTWKEIRRKIRDDPRCTKFSSHEKKREKEFDEYMVQRRAKAKQEFKDLLRETRLINHRSAELASDSGQQLRDIIAILQKDKRYLVLDSMPEERMDILMGYINEVAKRAPSPPPTACDPRSRNPLR